MSETIFNGIDQAKLDDIYQELAEKLINDDVVLFVGAGISYDQAGLPLWHKLLKNLTKKLKKTQHKKIKALLDEEELLIAAELIKKEICKGIDDDAKAHLALKKAIEEALQPKNDKAKTSPNIYPLIRKLNFPVIITTNYDTLLEDHLNKKLDKTTEKIYYTITPNNFKPYIPRTTKLLIKLHGCIQQDIEGLVFAYSDYRKMMYEKKQIEVYLDHLFSSKTVIFIGYGLNDINLKMTLDRINTYYGGDSVKHYALMPKSKVSEGVQSFYEDSYGIRTLLLEGDEFKNIYKFLYKLSEHKEKRGKAVADAYSQHIFAQSDQYQGEYTSAIKFHESARQKFNEIYESQRDRVSSSEILTMIDRSGVLLASALEATGQLAKSEQVTREMLKDKRSVAEQHRCWVWLNFLMMTRTNTNTLSNKLFEHIIISSNTESNQNTNEWRDTNLTAINLAQGMLRIGEYEKADKVCKFVSKQLEGREQLDENHHEQEEDNKNLSRLSIRLKRIRGSILVALVEKNEIPDEDIETKKNEAKELLECAQKVAKSINYLEVALPSELGLIRLKMLDATKNDEEIKNIDKLIETAKGANLALFIAHAMLVKAKLYEKNRDYNNAIEFAIEAWEQATCDGGQFTYRRILVEAVAMFNRLSENYTQEIQIELEKNLKNKIPTLYAQNRPYELTNNLIPKSNDFPDELLTEFDIASMYDLNDLHYSFMVSEVENPKTN